MGDAIERFEVSGSTVLVDGQPLAMSAEGFQVLFQSAHSHSAWLKNVSGCFYLESDMAPWTLKKLKCGALVAIDQDYAKDENTVFWGATPIPGADPATFKVVKHEMPLVSYFAYDKHQLYALSGAREGLQIWTDVDTASLAFFDEEPFFADHSHLYHFNGYFIEYLNPRKNKGMEAFEQLLKQRHPDADAWWNWTDDYLAGLRPLGHGYQGDEKRVFYHFVESPFASPYGGGFGQDSPCHLVLKGADPATFQPMNALYGKDRQQVYHLARPIDADPNTFRIIEGAYAADRSGIWFNGYLCPEADVASFEVIHWARTAMQSFARDKATMFSAIYGSRIGKFKGYSTLLKPMKNSHPASFVRLNDIWAKDDHNVYCYGKVWPGIDAGSFEFLFADPTYTARSYAKCNNGLYDANGRKTVKGIDGETFHMLNSFWGKDQNSVYSFKTDRIQKRMDAATFEVTDDAGGARDKDFDYSLDSLNSVVRKKRKA